MLEETPTGGKERERERAKSEKDRKERYSSELNGR